MEKSLLFECIVAISRILLKDISSLDDVYCTFRMF